MFENFCTDIIQTMKCLALQSFNLSCQAEHTKNKTADLILIQDKH